MGGDGGVIAAKREYMQSCGDVFGMKGGMAKTALNRTETAELRTKVCAVSNERLREPVAACELGYLYNKDTLISGLLSRNLNPAFNHIRGLKDVVDCRLTPNPASLKEDRPCEGPEPSRYMCPVTLQEMNGSHAFVVLFSTGWVMAEKATKEVGIAELQEEYGPFTESDIVPLAPPDEERETLTRNLIAKRDRARLAKKSSKKNSKRGKAVAARSGAALSASSSASSSAVPAQSSAAPASTSEPVERATGALSSPSPSSKLPGEAGATLNDRKQTASVDKDNMTTSSNNNDDDNDNDTDVAPEKDSTSSGGSKRENPKRESQQEGEDSKAERKNKRRRRRAEKERANAAFIAAGGASAGPNSSRVAGAAAQAVKKNKEDSKVYASLFGKKGVTNEHLFIATAGHRYNLG